MCVCVCARGGGGVGLLNLNEVFKGIVWMQNSFYSFCQITLTLILPIMRSLNVVSEASPQYVLQSEISKSNTQYSGIFKVSGNYTAGCVTF